MDNKQIEEAVDCLTPIDENFVITTESLRAIVRLRELAQLFLSVKCASKKKSTLCTIEHTVCEICKGQADRNIGYNLCHDEFTAWLAGRMEKLTEVQLPYPATFTLASPDGKINTITLSHEAATAIKTIILEGEK